MSAQKLHVGLPLDQMLDAQEAAVFLQKAHIALMKVERARRAAMLAKTPKASLEAQKP